MSQRTPCDRFYEEDPFSWYILLFEGISALGLLINCYVIYCLIRRSPKDMKTYKWYLLYHQIVALMADTGYNFIGRPVVFFPFTCGYPMSIFRGLISTHLLTISCLGGTMFCIATIVHLFWFRYLIIRRLNHPPLHYWIGLSLLYFTTAVLVIQTYRIPYDSEVTVEKIAKEYTCINTYLLQIDGFIMYDPKIVSQFIMPFLLFWVLICGFQVSYLIIFSLRETYVANMSLQLARLNRKFLTQLIVQVATPFCIIAVPFSIYGLSVLSEQIFLGQGFANVLLAANASFSSTSGVVLVIMTPAYLPAFLQKGRLSIKPVPAVSITQSRVTGITRNARMSVPNNLPTIFNKE